MSKSLDPRIERANLDFDSQIEPLSEKDQFQTYEVFHQTKRGQQHVHVGIVHAPSPEMALVYAKEQYSRRGQTSNLWVVPSAQVMATEYFDEDIFETTPEKMYRDASVYKVMDRIKAYKEKTSK